LVLDPVPQEERPGARWAGAERGHPESQGVPLPDHRGHRERAAVELLPWIGIGPGDELAARIEEGLDREGAVDLDHPFLVAQRLVLAPVDPRHRPVGLLAEQILGIEPGGRRGGDRGEEGVWRLREAYRLDGDVRDAEATPAAAALEGEAHEARLGVGHVHVGAATLPGLGVDRTRPGSAVGRPLAPVRHREVLRVPVDDEAAELAIAAEVEDEPLWIRASLALPLRRRRGIDGPARLEAGPEAR